MDKNLARFLCRLTGDFYAANSGSFSQTRQSAWPGWLTCAEVLRKEGLLAAANAPRSLSVLDLACGNMRFERFFSQVASPLPVRYCAVDSCDELAVGASDVLARDELARDSGDALARDGSVCGGQACDVPAQSLGYAVARGQGDADAAMPGGSMRGEGGRAQINYRKLDITDALFSGKHLSGEIGASSCDLAVSFGFMHHIPLFEQRCMVLDALIDSVRPGGFVAVSLWRFLHDENYAVKARLEHEKAMSELGLPSLDEGDCILGWNGAQGAYRYCHSFSDAEIDRLAKCVAKRADVVARFCADGRTQEMNAYLVLRRREQPRAKPSGMIEMNEPFYQRVYEQVRRVPEGKVCTYGTIAKLAGYPRAAREVGLAMSRVQREWNLPCHRIVNAKGTLAPAHAFGGKENQRRLLESEGVTFLDDGTIDMKRHWWPADDDLTGEGFASAERAVRDSAAVKRAAGDAVASGVAAGGLTEGAPGQLTLGF